MCSLITRLSFPTIQSTTNCSTFCGTAKDGFSNACNPNQDASRLAQMAHLLHFSSHLQDGMIHLPPPEPGGQ
jgi:hypothetical protein